MYVFEGSGNSARALSIAFSLRICACSASASGLPMYPDMIRSCNRGHELADEDRSARGVASAADDGYCRLLRTSKTRVVCVHIAYDRSAFQRLPLVGYGEAILHRAPILVNSNGVCQTILRSREVKNGLANKYHSLLAFKPCLSGLKLHAETIRAFVGGDVVEDDCEVGFPVTISVSDQNYDCCHQRNGLPTQSVGGGGSYRCQPSRINRAMSWF